MVLGHDVMLNQTNIGECLMLCAHSGYSAAAVQTHAAVWSADICLAMSGLLRGQGGHLLPRQGPHGVWVSSLQSERNLLHLAQCLFNRAVSVRVLSPYGTDAQRQHLWADSRLRGLGLLSAYTGSDVWPQDDWM